MYIQENIKNNPRLIMGMISDMKKDNIKHEVSIDSLMKKGGYNGFSSDVATMAKSAENMNVDENNYEKKAKHTVNTMSRDIFNFIGKVVEKFDFESLHNIFPNKTTILGFKKAIIATVFSYYFNLIMRYLLSQILKKIFPEFKKLSEHSEKIYNGIVDFIANVVVYSRFEEGIKRHAANKNYLTEIQIIFSAIYLKNFLRRTLKLKNKASKISVFEKYSVGVGLGLSVIFSLLKIYIGKFHINRYDVDPDTGEEHERPQVSKIRFFNVLFSIADYALWKYFKEADENLYKLLNLNLSGM